VSAPPTLRRFVWRFVERWFADEINAIGIASYEEGYSDGYAANEPPEGAWQDEFEKGYAAAMHDVGER
jgi:hypothetical protein